MHSKTSMAKIPIVPVENQITYHTKYGKNCHKILSVYISLGITP